MARAARKLSGPRSKPLPKRPNGVRDLDQVTSRSFAPNPGTSPISENAATVSADDIVP
jgi:hypothetical protein